jgi:hypothetical protein
MKSSGMSETAGSMIALQEIFPQWNLQPPVWDQTHSRRVHTLLSARAGSSASYLGHQTEMATPPNRRLRGAKRCLGIAIVLVDQHRIWRHLDGNATGLVCHVSLIDEIANIAGCRRRQPCRVSTVVAKPYPSTSSKRGAPLLRRQSSGSVIVTACQRYAQLRPIPAAPVNEGPNR